MKNFGSAMNNASRFIFTFFAISLCCNAAEQQLTGYRSIPFNCGVIDNPNSILYTTGKKFAIAGDTGYEVQRNNGLNVFGRCHGSWKLSKDGEKIAAFNMKSIAIVDLDSKISDITKTMRQELIIDVALDASKNTIFIAYDIPRHKSGIMQYCYDSNTTKYFQFKDHANCCSLALSPKKDIVCLLDNYAQITLRRTNALGVIFKRIILPTADAHVSCVFSPNGVNLAVSGRQSVYIIDNYDHVSRVLRCNTMVQAIAFHPSIAFHPYGLLSALISNRSSGNTLIKYWDIITKEEIDTTTLPKIIGRNLCFRDDGFELAMATVNDCIVMPVSREVIKQYVLPPLWMKLKIIQKQCNLPQDILVCCMNVLTAYCR